MSSVINVKRENPCILFSWPFDRFGQTKRIDVMYLSNATWGSNYLSVDGSDALLWKKGSTPSASEVNIGS